METAFIITIAAIILLLIFSAFFSSSETALMGLSKARMHSLEKDGNKAAKRVNKMAKKPETLLSTILLGNNLVNIGASALATGVFIQIFGDKGIAFATLIMTFLVLIFAEVIPKTLASRRPNKFAMVVSAPMSFLIKALRPFTWFIEKLNHGLFKMMGIQIKSDADFHQSDVKGAIGLGLAHGVLEDSEHRMLDSILGLNDITVESVMVHRSAMEMLNVDDSEKDIYKIVSKSSHSRFPVYKDEPDNIIGFLHIKDYYKAINASNHKNENFDLSKIITEPYFVPENVAIKEQMSEFRNLKTHMGIVVDEYGDIQGLVTLEDILEEIVGEIEDEHDKESANYVHNSDGSITISGSVTVRDANRDLGWHLPEDEAVTIAGLIIEVAEKIPALGEKVRIDGLKFTILSKKRQAILKVQAKPVK